VIRGRKSALAGRHQFYRYASRYLMERVSWPCRDHRKPDIAPLLATTDRFSGVHNGGARGEIR
jgi:hypothetical protein